MATTSSESGRYLLTRPQARDLLGLKRRQFDALVGRGDLTLEQIGPWYYVPRVQVDALIARWSEPSPAVE